MSSLFIRADCIITIYDQRNVPPVRNAIRRETNQPDLPTPGTDTEIEARVGTNAMAKASLLKGPFKCYVTLFYRKFDPHSPLRNAS